MGKTDWKAEAKALKKELKSLTKDAEAAHPVAKNAKVVSPLAPARFPDLPYAEHAASFLPAPPSVCGLPISGSSRRPISANPVLLGCRPSVNFPPAASKSAPIPEIKANLISPYLSEITLAGIWAL